MFKRWSILVMVLAATSAFGQASQPSPLRAAALESLGRAVLSSHGDSYLILVNNGKLNIRVDDIGHPIRISAAEGRGKTSDWYDHAFVSGALTDSSDAMKELTLEYSYVYGENAPGAESRRAKADEAPAIEATVRMTLRVYADKPGLHVTYTLTNPGEPYVYYLLPWINGSSRGFTTPGDSGPVEHDYAGKYADVSNGEMGWVLVERDDEHVGLVFPDAATMFVGEFSNENSDSGSIYLNAIPRYADLPTGASMTVDMVIVPVANVDELVDAAKAYGVE